MTPNFMRGLGLQQIMLSLARATMKSYCRGGEEIVHLFLGLGRDFLQAAQVKFARAQVRQRFHMHELIGSRLPQRRQVRLSQQREARFQLVLRQGVQHDQPFALSLIGNGGYGESLVGATAEFVQLVFDLDVGTISPPILLNRLMRSVMRMNPSSSTAAMSPVL